VRALGCWLRVLERKDGGVDSSVTRCVSLNLLTHTHTHTRTRPTTEHGGRDRHFCIGVANVDKLAATLEAASIPFTRSMSGRPAIFFRDPDANTLECVELEPWR
jgi:hypothetical protein